MAYQKDIPAYLISGDKEEFDRLNYKYKLLAETSGSLYCSPVVFSKDQRVLDIGCGTGNWAIDLAKAHPHHQTWQQFEAKFDFSHGRLISPAVHDWPTLIRRCFEVLKPGAWLGFQDQILPPRCVDDMPVLVSPFLTMGQYLAGGAAKMGLSIDAMEQLPELAQRRILAAGPGELQDDCRSMAGGLSGKALGRDGADKFQTFDH